MYILHYGGTDNKFAGKKFTKLLTKCFGSDMIRYNPCQADNREERRTDMTAKRNNVMSAMEMCMCRMCMCFVMPFSKKFSDARLRDM